MPNKYKAVYASHSSIGDFRACERAYWLKNVYKDKDGDKISTVSPYLSLGTCVHNCLEPLAKISPQERQDGRFAPTFFAEWEKLKGDIGGWKDEDQREEFKQRGISMLRNVRENIHHLMHPTDFLVPDDSLPMKWMSEEGNGLILCGKLDFLQKIDDYYLVTDFKTGLKLEKSGSLQLNIYSILLNHYKGDSKFRANYWYVGMHPDPIEKELPSLEESKSLVLDIMLKMQEARARGEFKCPHNGCFACQDLEQVFKQTSNVQYVGKGTYGAKMYKIN